MTKQREVILSVLLACFSTLFAYIAVEIGYRMFEYNQMSNQLVGSILERIPNDGQGNSIFDANTGYRYRAHMEVGPRRSPFPVHYRTNSHGLIAREDFPAQKPGEEFRIGFIGDSFTAGVMSTIRWTDIVEDRLNASAKWRQLVGNRHTRCLNFGLDGIGAVQFGAVADNIAKPFDVDLLIINMLKEDVVRRPYYRGYRTNVSRNQIEQYAEHVVAQLPWFGIYPEALAAAAGRFFGMTTHLSLAAMEKAFWGERLYDNPAEAVDASANSIHQILRYFPNAVFLLDQTYKEYTDIDDPLVNESFSLFQEKTPEVHWVMMIDQLPKPTDKSEIDSWFNVPDDQHKNALGSTLYGNAVANYLIGFLAENNNAARRK